MNETGTAARALINPTESEQKAETQIRRPSFRLISGLENTALFPLASRLKPQASHQGAIGKNLAKGGTGEIRATQGKGMRYGGMGVEE